jgi:PadR family transcriptional regulator PadR
LYSTKFDYTFVLENNEMNVENIQSQMKKGVLEFCILTIIDRGEVYPADIVEELKGKGMPVLEGTLYPLLTRLKKAGYLDYRWVESTGGPPRKYFSMNAEGKKFYKVLETTWGELAAAVKRITK